ncbi:MAG TPA: MFS transporter, partial [Spirillospora sp.]|nr:MFS transporter [Spirillospora sp.]
GFPAGAAAAAHDSIGGAAQAAAALGGPAGQALLAAARDAFAAGLRCTAGVGAAVLLATAVAAWILLKDQRHGTTAD